MPAFLNYRHFYFVKFLLTKNQIQEQNTKLVFRGRNHSLAILYQAS